MCVEGVKTRLYAAAWFMPKGSLIHADVVFAENILTSSQFCRCCKLPQQLERKHTVVDGSMAKKKHTHVKIVRNFERFYGHAVEGIPRALAISPAKISIVGGTARRTTGGQYARTFIKTHLNRNDEWPRLRQQWAFCALLLLAMIYFSTRTAAAEKRHIFAAAQTGKKHTRQKRDLKICVT